MTFSDFFLFTSFLYLFFLSLVCHVCGCDGGCGVGSLSLLLLLGRRRCIFSLAASQSDEVKLSHLHSTYCVSVYTFNLRALTAAITYVNPHSSNIHILARSHRKRAENFIPSRARKCKSIIALLESTETNKYFESNCADVSIDVPEPHRMTHCIKKKHFLLRDLCCFQNSATSEPTHVFPRDIKTE